MMHPQPTLIRNRRDVTLCIPCKYIQPMYYFFRLAFIKMIFQLQHQKWDTREPVTGRQQNTATKCDKNVEGRHFRRQIWRQHPKYFVHLSELTQSNASYTNNNNTASLLIPETSGYRNGWIFGNVLNGFLPLPPCQGVANCRQKLDFSFLVNIRVSEIFLWSNIVLIR